MKKQPKAKQQPQAPEPVKELPKENKTGVSSKLIKRIAFDWFLLVGLYMSFVLFIIIEVGFTTYESEYADVPLSNMLRSLTGIGWRQGDMGKLIFYLLFTVGFMVYQACLFKKLSGKKHRTIFWMMIAGSALMIVGSCFPVEGNKFIPNVPYVIDVLHTVISTAGIGVIVVAVGLMVIAYCRETVGTIKSKAMVFVPFIALLVMGVVGFISTTSGNEAFATAGQKAFLGAAFTLMATFMAMVYVHYLTVCFEVAGKKPN